MVVRIGYADQCNQTNCTITLTVGNIDLTYNTGYIGVDHGMLYQECDRQYRFHPSIN